MATMSMDKDALPKDNQRGFCRAHKHKAQDCIQDTIEAPTRYLGMLCFDFKSEVAYSIRVHYEVLNNEDIR